jgi:hypothetical protein
MTGHHSRRTWKIRTDYTRRLGELLDRLLQQEQAAEKGQPGELEFYSRDMEEEACPSQENTLSKVHRNRQAVAQNLRVWTRKTRPEREPFPPRPNEKNSLLDLLFRAFLVLGDASLDELRH